MSEEIIKKAIVYLNGFNPNLNIWIKEERQKAVMLPPLNETDDETISDQIKITILRNNEPLFSTSYFVNQAEYRPLAFERMLQTILLSGLVNHPSLYDLATKGYTTP